MGQEPYYGVYVNSMGPGDVNGLADAMCRDFVQEPERIRKYLPNRYPDWLDNPTQASWIYAQNLPVPEPGKHAFIAYEHKKCAGIVKILKDETTKDADVAYWFTKTRERYTDLAKKAVAEAITTVFKRDPEIKRMIAPIMSDSTSSLGLIQHAMIAFHEEPSEATPPTPGSFACERFFVKTRAEWVAPVWYPDPPYTCSHIQIPDDRGQGEP